MKALLSLVVVIALVLALGFLLVVAFQTGWNLFIPAAFGLSEIDLKAAAGGVILLSLASLATGGTSANASTRR